MNINKSELSIVDQILSLIRLPGSANPVSALNAGNAYRAFVMQKNFSGRAQRRTPGHIVVRKGRHKNRKR